jgi:N-acetylglucosaminyl-diphospho-decaprenol L-rhamnosyltransferase
MYAMGISLDTLTTIVLNWETPDYTIRCVEALIDEGVRANRLVVVDNGSKDGSYDRLGERLSSCVLLALEENIGFGPAANLGAREVPGEAYLFVDNDAFVHAPGSVRKLLAAADDPAVGLVVPRVLNPDLSLHRTVAPIQTPTVALVRASGLSRLIPNRWQPRWSTHWDHLSSREISGATSPVILIRRAVWDELGGFDEAYAYAQDLDLCWRARARGWKIWFVADAVFVHIAEGSTQKRWKGAQRAEMVSRSEATMIRRHLSTLRATLSIAFLTAGSAGRWLAFSLLRKREAAQVARGTLRGCLSSYRPPEVARAPRAPTPRP